MQYISQFVEHMSKLRNLHSKIFAQLVIGFRNSVSIKRTRLIFHLLLEFRYNKLYSATKRVSDRVIGRNRSGMKQPIRNDTSSSPWNWPIRLMRNAPDQPPELADEIDENSS